MNETACHAGELLWMTAEALRRVDRGLARGNPAKEAVMRVVLSYPEGVMLKEIAREVERTAGAVSQTIEALVRENMVSRTVSARDRRAVTIFPTPEGRERRSAHMRRINGVVGDALRSVSDSERAVFEKVLGVVARFAAKASF